MNHRDDIIFKRWLAAESGGRDAAAEQALNALFAGLPQAVPGVGFADRVLAAALRRPAAMPGWSRAAIAASLLSAGLAAALLLPLALSLVRFIAPGEAVGALVQGFIAAASRVDELLWLGRLGAQVVEAALLIVTAPPVVLSLLTLTALSAFTFRGLRRALVPYRSPEHVPG